MNNIQKKNKIYGLSYRSELPSKSVSDVTVKANQIIYTSVNNNMEKLVDNDLFIEKQLQNAQQYQIGPKKYNHLNLDSKENGYKMWNKDINDNVELSIFRKVDDELQEMITSTNIKSRVNFILDNGSERLIGTEVGLCRLDTTSNQYIRSKSGSLKDINVISYAYDINNSLFLFSTSNGIYQTNGIYPNEDINFTKRSELININKLFLVDGIVYIYYNNVVQSASLTESGYLNFQPYKTSTNTYLENEELISVNKINNQILITTDKGVYGNIEEYSFNNITETIFNIEGIKNKFLIKFDNTIYVATNKGLYDINGDKIHGSSSSSVYNYFIDNNVLYLLIGRTLYKLQGESLEQINTFDSSFENESIGVIDDIIIVTNGPKIYWKNIYSTNEWNEIELGNTKNPSQFFSNNLMIAGVKNEEFNISEIGIKNIQVQNLYIKNNFGLNKIVYYNGNVYYLTKQGLYLNNISLNNKILDGDITDISFEGNKWCAIINNKFYWSNDISFNESNIKNYNSLFYGCRILDNCLYVIDGNNKIQYQLDVDFGSTLDLKNIDSEIKVYQLETFNNEIYVLSDDKKLYKLEPQHTLILNKQEIDYPSDDYIKGFNYSFSNQGKSFNVFYSTDNNIYTYNLSSEISNYTYNKVGNVSKYGNIQYISEYFYFYDVGDQLYSKKYNKSKNRYDIISCVESWTKDIYTVYQDGKLNLYELSCKELLNEETNEYYKTGQTYFYRLSSFDIDIPNIKGIFQMYDKKMKNSELLSSNYTFIFGENSIQYEYMDFDKDIYDIWEVYQIPKYEGNISASLSVIEFYSTYIVFDDLNINKLKGLKCVTNVNSLTDENILFFVTNNKLYYYIQNKNNSLIQDFNNDNIIEINIYGIDVNSIQDIAATLVTNGVEQSTTHIRIYLKTNSHIYSTDISIIDLKVKNINDIVWVKNFIDNINFNIDTFIGEIIATSNTPMSYNTFENGTNVEFITTSENNVLKIKTDQNTNQFYKIKTDQVSLINFDDSQQNINVKNIENISFVDDKYYFMGTNGLSATTNFSTSLSSVPLLNDKSLTDIGINIYGTDTEIYGIHSVHKKEPYIIKTIKTDENHLNFKYDDNYNITFNDDTYNLKILNPDFSSSQVTFLTENEENVNVSKETDNLIIDIDGNIYDKNNGKKIISKRLTGLSSGIPIIIDEKDEYIITYPYNNILKQYDNIGIYKYFDKKIDIENINKVFNFDNEKLFLIENNILYYYYPETNTYFIKYISENDIKKIVIDNNNFIICEGDEIYSISQRFNNKTNELLLTCDNIVDFDKNSKFDYLLGTSVGLFKTVYNYTLENDIPLCSVTDIKEYTKETFNNGLQKHIEDLHNIYSTISKINDDIMPIDCSNLKGIEKNDEIVDYVKTVEFSDGVQYISAYVRFDNDLSVNNTFLSGIQFISKNFSKQNICELFVYIPSTNTNYINHNTEIKNDNSVTNVIYRKNVGVSTNCYVNDNKTNITLQIDKYHFDINRIVAVDINGNSLPLNIYIDKDNSKIFSFDGYSSVVKKSMYKQLVYDEKNDIITLDFMCFGTDAQAIRLETIMNIRYIIRYHKSDGIYEESYIRDIDYDVPFYSEIVNGKQFAGWGRIESSIVEFKYKTKFRNIGKKGEIIDLYPIYEEYIFDASDSTIFTLKPTQKQIYFDGGIINNELVQVDYDF